MNMGCMLMMSPVRGNIMCGFILLILYVLRLNAQQMQNKLVTCPNTNLAEVYTTLAYNAPFKYVEHVYYLDENGRTVWLCAIIYEEISHKRPSIGKIFGAIFRYENPKFDIGHILPHRYRGMYNSEHFFPQIPSLNRGLWSRFENLEVNLLSVRPRQYFFYSVRLYYSGLSYNESFPNPTRLISSIFDEYTLYHTLDVLNLDGATAPIHNPSTWILNGNMPGVF